MTTKHAEDARDDLIAKHRPGDTKRDETDEAIRVERSKTDAVRPKRDALPETDAGNPLAVEREATDRALAGERAQTDALVVDQRDANEQMVTATVRAQELTDEAQAARERAERSEREVELRAKALQVEVEQRKQLQQELEQRNKQKDEFIALLGHELRNPLAALAAALAVRDRTESDDEGGRRLKEACNRQVGNLARLVDDLLDVSRITMGKVELRRELLDLRLLTEQAVETCRSMLDARKHEFTLTIEAGSFRVHADATRLEQVLVNLIGNAAKYTPVGGRISLKIEREAIPNGSVALIRVSDNGDGISPQMLERIFDPFTQINPTLDRTRGGLGIGLTLVRKLVELHGGRVTAHSEGPGRGSAFIIRLPLANDELRVSAAPPPPGPPAGLEASPNRRILLIEDNQDLRESMCDLLQNLGHQVCAAANGTDGVRMFQDFGPDLALVDVGLPDIDGYEVARQVRAASAGHPVYLVALTGYSGPDAEAKSLAAGFNQHVIKPIRLDDLRVILKSGVA